ncbi:MAG: arsenate reductase ArsC [Bacteroidota bacterium]
MKNILFVCVENSCRSQMAQAFAQMHGDQHLNAYSSGSRPSGVVNPKAIAAMKERGYDLSQHRSTGLDELPEVTFDHVITMGCGDACPHVPAVHRGDWELPDPKHMRPKEFNAVRDNIEQRVLALLERMAAGA